jgi:hypothetical protein
MILQITPDPGQIVDRLDPEGCQLRRRPYSCRSPRDAPAYTTFH